MSAHNVFADIYDAGLDKDGGIGGTRGFLTLPTGSGIVLESGATFTLSGSGATTLGGNLTVTGNTTHTGTLTQTGASSFAGAITITDVNVVLSATTGTKIGTATTQKLSFFNATPIVQPTALTAAKPTFTIADAEGTPDNAIQAVTQTTPFGFANAAEAITILYKIQNMHTRLGELETKLQALGLLA